MKKSEIYLEKHTLENPNFVKIVTLEHAKTYGKIVELEKEIEFWIADYNYQESTEVKMEIEKRKSEIDKLMGL